MQRNILKISPALLCFGLLCFLLPFFSVFLAWPNTFINGIQVRQKLFTISGLQVATGMTFQEPGMFGLKYTIEPEPFAILALLAGIGGAIYGFVRGRFSRIASGVFGLGAFILMMALKFKFDSNASKQPTVQFNSGIGFWAASLFFLVGGILTFLLLKFEKGPTPRGS
jgi:hypothetical protein